MTSTVKDVLEFAQENDIKFIRLSFCDILGRQKNISIMPTELEAAFEDGISFDASAIRGFNDVTKSDLLLFPDPSTITVLPWRPQTGRVARFYCDIKNPDGLEFICDTRRALKFAVKKANQMGFVPKIGAECEFYLFKTDENGQPTDLPLDDGGYLDIAPRDKGENVRREICLTLEEMGIKPESSHHEQGPGQNEIDFKFDDALVSADNLLTFKWVVRTVAAGNGLFASFAPKPLANKSGNGLHINISLSKNGVNIMAGNKDEDQKIIQSFMAGILEKTPEITAFLNPIPNSYERLGAFEAPKFVSWSRENRSQLIRIPAAKGEKMRIELRSPDPKINPYIAFALVIHAGLYGIENKLEAPNPMDLDLYTEKTDHLTPLPKTLKQALALAKESNFVREALGEELHAKYIAIRESE